MNFKIISVITIVIFLIFTSCKKDNENIVNDSITEEEAAEVVEEALSVESGGMTVQLTEATEMASDMEESTDDNCGMSFDSTINIVNPAGTVITFEYTITWNWQLNCNEFQLPDNVTFHYDLSGWYDAPRIKGNNDGSHNFTLSGLSETSDDYVYSGNYKRTGDFEIKTGLQRSFTSDISIEATDLTLSKSTGMITGGTAIITFSAKTSAGNECYFNGTITFNGDETATLVFNNEYNIQL